MKCQHCGSDNVNKTYFVCKKCGAENNYDPELVELKIKGEKE